MEDRTVTKRLTKNLIVGILMLAVALALVSTVAGYVASLRVGHIAYAVSALAALVVWLAGCLSLFLTMRASVPRVDGQGASVTALLLAMLLRIGLPLAAVVCLTQLGTQVGGESHVAWAARLREAGFFGLVVVHYLAALMIETALGARWLSRQDDFPSRPCHSHQAKAGSF